MTIPANQNNDSQSSNDKQSFLDHIEELRATLIKCLTAVSLMLIPAFLATPYLIDALIAWATPKELSGLAYFSPMEVFVIQIKFAAVVAVAASFPYCLWQIWNFLAPALYEKERKALKLWVSSSVFLFALGSAFCVYFILPLIMKFSASFAGEHIQPVIGLGNFLSLSGWLALAFGAMFQFPLAVMIAIRFGIVKRSFLSDKRPYVIVGILIISAILTPPDVVSQMLLAAPTYILFEIGLFFSRFFEV